MFYVCQKCGKYNLASRPCVSCGCTHSKSAAFSSRYIELIPRSHKMWTNNLYHYVCVSSVRDIANLFLTDYTEQMLVYLNGVKYCAINRGWDGVDNDDRYTAEEFFPTPEVQERIDKRKAYQEQQRLKLEAQMKAELEALSAYPDWFKTFSAAFGKSPVLINLTPSFEDNGMVFKICVSDIKPNEKQTVVFDCSRVFGQEYADLSAFKANEKISLDIYKVKSLNELFFKVVKKYSPQFYDSNRLYFITVF